MRVCAAVSLSVSRIYRVGVGDLSALCAHIMVISSTPSLPSASTLRGNPDIELFCCMVAFCVMVKEVVESDWIHVELQP